MRVPQPDIIEHFGNADAVPQLPERCLSRKAGIVRCCLNFLPRWGAALPPLPGLFCFLCLQKQNTAQDFWQYRIILSADTASEVRQMLSQKRR